MKIKLINVLLLIVTSIQVIAGCTPKKEIIWIRSTDPTQIKAWYDEELDVYIVERVVENKPSDNCDLPGCTMIHPVDFSIGITDMTLKYDNELKGFRGQCAGAPKGIRLDQPPEMYIIKP